MNKVACTEWMIDLLYDDDIWHCPWLLHKIDLEKLRSDIKWPNTWWRHQMETFSALLAICEFPSQRPVTRSFDVFFDLRLNKRLSKRSWGWWFETLSHPLWRHCNVSEMSGPICMERKGDEMLGEHFSYIVEYLTWPVTLNQDFQGHILKLLYF